MFYTLIYLKIIAIGRFHILSGEFKRCLLLYIDVQSICNKKDN